MLPNSPQKIDPRVKRTREALLQSFGDLLAGKNFESISVQDVTEQAQLNRATFYAHFQDKYDLLNFFIRESFMREVEKRALNACHYSPDNLRSLLLAVCEFLARAHSGCAQPHQQFEALIEPAIKNQIFEILLHWLKQEPTRPSADLSATAATWAMYGLAAHYSHMKKRPALEKFVDEALPLAAANLGQLA